MSRCSTAGLPERHRVPSPQAAQLPWAIGGETLPWGAGARSRPATDGLRHRLPRTGWSSPAVDADTNGNVPPRFARPPGLHVCASAPARVQDARRRWDRPDARPITVSANSPASPMYSQRGSTDAPAVDRARPPARRAMAGSGRVPRPPPTASSVSESIHRQLSCNSHARRPTRVP
jgi:hypothetical protein